MSLAGMTQDYQALLEAYLHELNLPMFLQLYQSYAQDAARSGLSFERFLLALCEAEVGDREAKRIESAIRRAKFPFLKELTDYDGTRGREYPQNHFSGTGSGRLFAPR